MFKKIKNKSLKMMAILSVIILLATTFLIILSKIPKENEVEALSKYGSRGSEVTQIQTKLKRWGYYKGNVDGIYGSQTVEAVKYFQRKNGFTVDGIAGKKTLEAMGIFNSSILQFMVHQVQIHHDLNLLSKSYLWRSKRRTIYWTSSGWSSCVK